jgi:protein associated with RNAse G/E
MSERESSALEVRVMKYDGALHRRWRAKMLRRVGSLLILDAKFEEEVRHPQLGLIRRGTRSIEYYWLDRWFNVFRFLEPDGSLKNFYCNVNVPPVFEEGVLSYVDLDIDLLVAPDLSYEVLDMDEFEDNAKKYGYTEEIQRGAQHALLELQTMIKGHSFPFDLPGVEV